jgi:hypothetical protein
LRTHEAQRRGRFIEVDGSMIGEIPVPYAFMGRRVGPTQALPRCSSRSSACRSHRAPGQAFLQGFFCLSKRRWALSISGRWPMIHP